MLEAVGDLDDTGVWESITVSDLSLNTTVLLHNEWKTIRRGPHQDSQSLPWRYDIRNTYRTTQNLPLCTPSAAADWDPLYAGWSAFISGLVVIVTHLILVLLVILMSRLSGVPGRFQNVWASISQLFGSVTEDWIREADTVDDKTVEWWLNDLGLHNVLLGIEYVQCRVYLVNKQKVS
ncbi:hypothetical protein NOF04DRAFT_1279982 [Fusarium oxysporum II5]|nr:hypothetical protein NOF04DRAFT_1279982 [Fusarium oxysporum II5]